ncbi:MAG: RlpA-like double-psi beta-barrel domain-containing protein [Anaerosomatales bacterium]|nr:RlpA-like double-psi beta-barrel domain-containing protein [Anaerosomatales bacterium]
MTRTRAFAALLGACLLGMCAASPLAIATSPAESSITPGPELQRATDRVLELEQTIEDQRAERIAIEERIAVTNLRIIAQQEEVNEARRALLAAQEAYRTRMVSMYKSRVADPVSVLLSSQNMADFYSRIFMLARIAQRDRRAYLDANVAAAEAQFQAAYLDDLKAQDVALRQLQRITLDGLDAALAEQRTLVERLTEEALRKLEARRAAIARTRKEWRESSVPLDDVVRFVPAVVGPYEGVTYLASEHHPRRYRTLGRSTSAYCSWYGNEFHGRLSACGQVYNQNDFTCASRTLPFGTRLALTRGDRRIIVVVTDRGPFIAGRDLDLSRAAARALGFSGLATVEVEFVEAIAE